jgi:hypothetical protein
LSRPATALALAFERARLRNRVTVVEGALRALNAGQYTEVEANRRISRAFRCEGKRVYSDSESASYAAAVQSMCTGKNIAHYKCEHCGYYHIGHDRRRNRKESAA